MEEHPIADMFMNWFSYETIASCHLERQTSYMEQLESEMGLLQVLLCLHLQPASLGIVSLIILNKILYKPLSMLDMITVRKRKI